MNEKKRKSDIKDLDIITTNVNANYANLIEWNSKKNLISIAPMLVCYSHNMTWWKGNHKFFIPSVHAKPHKIYDTVYGND